MSSRPRKFKIPTGAGIPVHRHLIEKIDQDIRDEELALGIPDE